MITFASLFLGLVVGVHPVEVLVGAGVAAVELRLDGETAGVLDGPPWKLDVDLGPELEPHELTAVALAGDGRELDRARQWINLYRPPAEVGIVVAGEGERRFARLTWQSLVSEEPQAVEVTFDGEPLPVEDPSCIPLPPYDPEQLHLLRAEIDFSSTVSAVAEVVLGGRFVDDLHTELTGVPVVADKPKKLGGAEELAGALRKDGEALEVVAVEKGPAEITVVVDSSAYPELGRLAERHLRLRRGLVSLRSTGPLKKGERLRLLWPVALPEQRGIYSFDMFPPSEEMDRWDGGVYWLLTRTSRMRYPEEQQRLADAVAVAGMISMARNRRRAVVLVAGPSPADHSRYRPEEVRRYLEKLGVPVVVWTPGEDAETLPGWAAATPITSMAHLEKAVGELHELLESQRLIWIEGRHLLREVELSERVVGIRLLR